MGLANLSRYSLVQGKRLAKPVEDQVKTATHVDNRLVGCVTTVAAPAQNLRNENDELRD